MKMYDVRITVDANKAVELLGLLEGDTMIKISVHPTPIAGLPEFVPEQLDSVPEPAKKRGGQRGPRGSKVQDTLRAVLTGGPQTPKQLRSTLENAGFSSGSLSTSLAQMIEKGEVEKSVDGTYRMAA
jgi:hypothetical protein